MTFTHDIRVRYAEVDVQGVVFNAHWLTYFDDAMTRWVESIGYDPKTTFVEDGAFDAMLVKSTIEWHGSAGYDDVVSVEVAPARIGTSSFDLDFTARVGDRDVVTATTTYVSVAPGERRSVPIPDDLRAALEDR